jgi:hypothetical protein
MEKIICAAIHFDDGREYPQQPFNIKKGLVIAGLRHCNCFGTMSATRFSKATPNIQGFITNKNRFVNRKEAFVIAVKADQIITQLQSDNLFSEDLY